MPDRESARLILERQALDSCERAEELRTVGENTRNPQARRSLLGLADDADAMADRIEERARALGRPNGSPAAAHPPDPEPT